MTKLSNAQQAAMWAVTHIEAGADAFAPIGRATANTLAARGFFQPGTLQLTEAGRDWIDEQIEAAHADAANEDYERGIAQDATWRDRHRSCCGAGVIVDLEARVAHDHADALKLNVSHVARAIVELIGDNEPFAKDMPSNDPRKVGGRYYGGYWAEEYTVLAIDRDPANWMSWSITVATDEEAANGTSRTHCTAWDSRRDRVVAEPTNPEA